MKFLGLAIALTTQIDRLQKWQIRRFKLLETRAKNRFTQEV